MGRLTDYISTKLKEKFPGNKLPGSAGPLSGDQIRAGEVHNVKDVMDIKADTPATVVESKTPEPPADPNLISNAVEEMKRRKSGVARP